MERPMLDVRLFTNLRLTAGERRRHVVAGVVTAVAAVLTQIYLPAHPAAPAGGDPDVENKAKVPEKLQ
ncbi:hypothetical protein [Williamsia soli]|uniref:hypothetical protein n=1 Tax=Williamsia soli TaxID=364929 RepID=UPI001A9E432E|nr:hypothetical protein [Williamsia soli]